MKEKIPGQTRFGLFFHFWLTCIFKFSVDSSYNKRDLIHGCYSIRLTVCFIIPTVGFHSTSLAHCSTELPSIMYESFSPSRQTHYIYIFKEYLKLLNRLYDITWFGLVYREFRMIFLGFRVILITSQHNYFLFLNAACLAEKRQIPILKSLAWPNRGSAHYLLHSRRAR